MNWVWVPRQYSLEPNYFAMITRSVSSTTRSGSAAQSGSVTNRSGPAAQSGSVTNRSGPLPTYRKTPLISTYVFSGLATEQVLIFGAVLSGGMIRRSEKSCKEGVCLIQCCSHTTRCCACFSDYAHTSSIQGYLYSGGMYFRALQPTANFSQNWRGTYFRRGTYLRGFTVFV